MGREGAGSLDGATIADASLGPMIIGHKRRSSWSLGRRIMHRSADPSRPTLIW